MPARILVIEDNKENLDLMTYLLRAFGHTVFAAQDGDQGLEMARRELPDLVLTDIQMPKVDGYEVLRAFRKDPRLAKRPLIAITAYAMRGDRERVIAAGFDGYISKPVVPEEFVGQIERFLGPGQHAHPQPEPAAGASPQAPDVPFHTTILAVDNSPVNLDLIESTLKPLGFRVIPVSNVRDAVSLAMLNPPDMILSDLHMPDSDGFDFFEAIRAEPRLKDIPFAIISSTFWPATDLNLALNLGVTTFIQRPLDPQKLIAEIQTCIAKSRRK